MKNCQKLESFVGATETNVKFSNSRKQIQVVKSSLTKGLVEKNTRNLSIHRERIMITKISS